MGGLTLNEDIIHTCRTLIALWDTFDELHSMCIHTPENADAFTKNIKLTSKLLLDKLKEVEGELNGK